MPKKDKVKLYSQALGEILAGKKFDEKKVITNFTKLLVSAGLEKKSKEILESAEEYLLKKKGNKKIIIESARKITSGQRKNLQKVMNDGDIMKEKINPELIAGIKILMNDEQLDLSMQNKINKLFS